MRRSEMLNIIQAELHICNGTYKASREKVAEAVLKAIEEAGMLPPFYQLPGLSGELHQAETRWEPEDA